MSNSIALDQHRRQYRVQPLNHLNWNEIGAPKDAPHFLTIIVGSSVRALNAMIQTVLKVSPPETHIVHFNGQLAHHVLNDKQWDALARQWGAPVINNVHTLSKTEQEQIKQTYNNTTHGICVSSDAKWIPQHLFIHCQMYFVDNSIDSNPSVHLNRMLTPNKGMELSEDHCKNWRTHAHMLDAIPWIGIDQRPMDTTFHLFATSQAIVVQ